MKYYLFISAACLLSTSSPERKYQDKKTFRELYALEGTWVMKTEKGFIGETWKKVNDDWLQSKGFFAKGADTISNESVALRVRSNGIYYTSTVNNQNDAKPVDFKLTSADIKTKTFVFENPQHDFPKRIIYEIVSNDSLHAYIDGGEGGYEEREDFYYHKAK